MKAFILNSGRGSRMGNIGTCKSLLEIAEGITIIDEQMRRLIKCGLHDIYITTGPYATEFKNYLIKQYPTVKFEFIHNPLYDGSNYIYSIYLARKYIQDDILLLHGDLVFDTALLQEAISNPHSCMIIDTTKPLPEKDFKAVLRNGKIKKVGVNFFESAVYAQPLYKLLWQDWQVWLDEICRFCREGNIGVYAENALNIISDKMNLFPLDAQGRMCFEIDDANDLATARDVYKQCNQSYPS